jgi:lambda family phage portal protein
MMLARCRDEVRNNPYAASAEDNFESQVIGNGIRPKWNVDSDALKLKLEEEFNIWASSKLCDHAGLLNFYGLQALVAREDFEAGEVLIRRHIRPLDWRVSGRKLRIPLQLQVIESEQMPIWKNQVSFGTAKGNSIRTGIEFDSDGRRVAYHMYREHPGETMFYPIEGLTFVRVPSDSMLHVYKPVRAGLLRGQPTLSSVLVLLHELDKYTDAVVVKKQIQTMFAGFIKKVSADGDVLPPDTSLNNSNSPYPYPPGAPDYGTIVSKIEPGTLQNLFPGEDITFPNMPQDNDIQTFLSVILHQFAVGIGATYEQITGDLRGVNLSSIRAGILDMRRKCLQFIYNIMVTGFCQPVLEWWLDEAVLSGRIRIPGYAADPWRFQDVTWNPSGWPWLDPLKDVQAKQAEVRNGFTSREMVCAERGDDVATVDAQQVADNERAVEMGLVYDSNPAQVLIGRETNPTEPAPPDEEPVEEVKKQEQSSDQEQAG